MLQNKALDPSSEEFFDKYGFKLFTSKKHPIYDDMMAFSGLEADYVGRLERDVEQYKEMIERLMASNDRLISRESYRLQDEIQKLKSRKD